VTHGTQITTAHGHLAFYALRAARDVHDLRDPPAIRGVKDYNPLGRTCVLVMTISMVFIVLTITGAGMVQVYMERLMASTTWRQDDLQPLFWVLRAIFGVGSWSAS